VIYPGQTKIFRVRCANNAGSWSAWKVVTIIKENIPAAPVNQPPAPPDIGGADMSTAPSVSALVNSNTPFTFRSADPDNDPIAYFVDWDNDGNNDERLPGGMAFVPSSVSVSTVKSWGSIGTYTFQVQAMDDNGNRSAYRSHTLLVNNPSAPTLLPPSITLTADRELIRSGEFTRVTLKVEANYSVTCTIYGISGGSVVANHSGVTNPGFYYFNTAVLLAQQKVSAVCQANAPAASFPPVSAEEIIEVVPAVQEV